MKVEIWSDVVCPFCYIGKRRFEQALNAFPGKNEVEIVWKSFQLDPDLVPIPGETVHEYLAKRKGVTDEEGKRMNDAMTAMAKEVGLDYHLDTAVVNNTFNAHRLLHLAKHHHLQNQMKERLFAAYYTESRNIGDIETLISLGHEVGLDKEEIRKALSSEEYAQQVALDIYEAQQIGVNGVPFFVFNDKYAVSGAQPTELFTELLEKVQKEEKPVLVNQSTEGVCEIGGDC